MSDAESNWPLPLLAARSSWRLEEPEPTNLLAFLARKNDLDPETVRAAFEATSGAPVRIVESIDQDDHEVRWCVVMRMSLDESLRTPLVVWLERAQPVHATPELNLSTCEWILGVETFLSAHDPLADFRRLLCLLGGSMPDLLAVLDVNTTKWHLRADLDRLIEQSDLEPAEEILWLVHCVGQAEGDDDSPSWLHTHGLWRCGRPELEMLNVPKGARPAATGLLHDVACLLLEQEPDQFPEPGEEIEIGHELSVTLRPWREIVPHLAARSPGGMNDRTGAGAEAHGGASAVITDPGATERGWPQAAVDRWARGDAVVFRTRRATARQEALAQATWPAFQRFFRLVENRQGRLEPSRHVSFGVKAGLADAAAVAEREHVWFDVLRIERHAMIGRLLNQPLSLNGMRKGDVMEIDVANVSDWRVIDENEQFDPSSAEAMESHVRRLESERATG